MKDISKVTFDLNNVSNFQVRSKIAKIRVCILPDS